MRVLLLNIIKPFKGSGDGTTEYTYQLYEKLQNRKDLTVDVDYFLDKAVRNNTRGLLSVYSGMRFKAGEIAKRKYDVIHVMSHEIGHIAKLLKKKGTKAKIITTVHDATRLESGMHKGVLQNAYNSIVRSNIRDAMEYSDSVIFVSATAKQEVERRFGVARGRHFVVMHGLREELFTVPIPKKRRSEFLTIGYIGSFAHHKNVITLLKAADLMKESSQKAGFVIYGTGFEEKNLKKYRREHDLDNVSFRGFAPESEIVRIYDSFDVFVFPSLYEGFGFHILEAQIRGIPVMVMKNASIPEEVKRYAIEVENEHDLVEKLKDLRKAEYKKWVLAAQIYARRFTWELAAGRTMKIYRKVCAS